MLLFFVTGDSKSEEVVSCYMHPPFLNHDPVKKEEKEDKDKEKGEGDNEVKVKIERPLPDDSSVRP